MFYFAQTCWPDGYGERLFLAAILRRAAYDIALYKDASRLVLRRRWLNAYKWMFDETDDHFTSFLSICNILDQDPGRVRRLTLTLTRKDVRKAEHVDHARL